MVSFKSFAAASIALAATFIHVEAAVAPTYPSPGTVQTEGQAYDLTWTFDGKNDQTYQIDFMTGSNDNQTVLMNVAKGVKPTDLKYNFVAPKVDPNSAVYFFMFTGSKGDVAWTTRFGIAGPGGALTAEPQSTQPNGDKIPWGQGKLAAAGANASVSAPAVSTAVVATSAAASSAASSVSSVTIAASTDAAAATSTPVAQAAASASTTSDASVLKPVLTLISAAVAGYFAF